MSKTYIYILLFSIFVLFPVAIGTSYLIKLVTASDLAQFLTLVPVYILIRLFINWVNKK